MSGPSVAIVILNWNGKDDTIECLESLDGMPFPRKDAGLFVLDNASNDGSQNAIEQALAGMSEDGWRELKLVQYESNLGFGRAYNRVTEDICRKYNYFYCSNNDIAFCENTLSPLVALMETDSKIGIAGPRVMSYSEPDKLAHGAGFINGIFCRPGFTEPDTNVDCDFLTGCALLIRSSVIQKLQFLFDPDFFAYWEDTDLCMRVKESDYRIVYCSEAAVLHKVSAATSETSGEEMNPARTYYKIHSKILFAKKHFPMHKKALFLAMYTARIPAFIIRCIVVSPGNAGSLVAAYIKACIHGFLGLPGKKYRS